MDSSDITRLVKRYWLPVVVFAFIGALFGGIVAATTPSSYRATTGLFVGTQQGQSVQDLVQGSAFSREQVLSYAELATKPVVINPVREELGLQASTNAVANQISVNVPLNTVLIEVTAVADSADDAAALANAVGASLAAEVTRLSPKTEAGDPSVVVNEVQPAQAPGGPSAPNTRLYVLLGLAAGLGIALLWAFAREILDTRIREDRDIDRVADTPILAHLAKVPKRDAQYSVMVTDPQSSAAESLRLLRTNLEYMEVDHPLKTVVVTSPNVGEGKSLTALGLALAVAETGLKTLLIDADLRRPQIADRLQIEPGIGLSGVLIGHSTASAAIVTVDTIDVLPAGAVPPNPNQLLNSEAAERLLDQVAGQYDIVILDSAPLVPVTDTLPLSKLADGTIVVVRVRHTRRPQLRTALTTLNTIQARVLGVALNGVKIKARGAYYSPGKRPAPIPPEAAGPDGATAVKSGSAPSGASADTASGSSADRT